MPPPPTRSLSCEATKFSPDGASIVTASNDNTARTWDPATAQEIAVLRGHEHFVNSAAFSPDERRVVTASLDNIARIWDAATAKEIAVLRHDSGVGSAAFSPDGTRIVTTSGDTVRIWDAANAKEVAVLHGHQDDVTSAAFSPAGKHIVTASLDSTVRIWNAATAKELSVLRGHEDDVTSAVFSPDGRHIVTASLDNTVRIWDAATVKVLAVSRGPASAIPIIQGVAASSEGAVWAVGFDGYVAYSRDAQSWVLLRLADKTDLLAVAAIRDLLSHWQSPDAGVAGKSSLMSLLMSDLQYYGGRAVLFNAWHHREEEHLLAALFESIRRNAPPGWWSWPGLAFRARLLWRRSTQPLTNLLYITLFAGIALITLHEALPTFHAEEVARMLHGAAGIVGQEVADTWQAALGVALAGSGGMALLALWLRGKLVALPANPAKLAMALAQRASLGDFSDKLTFRHRFGEQFDDICNALLTRTSPRVS